VADGHGRQHALLEMHRHVGHAPPDAGWTEPEWTESTQWTESTEDYGAKRSEAPTLAAERDQLRVAALLAREVQAAPFQGSGRRNGAKLSRRVVSAIAATINWGDRPQCVAVFDNDWKPAK